ncbi:MAG: chemotaxis protein CheB [Treponema sp.]|jgi:two-component system chemotaxis response regulator CheB|nr:chemotaxis protein CheB [Treponema sp.]
MINTLIVDDSPLARGIIRDFLEEEGSFNIIGEAVDGEDGVAKIFSLKPDLVTLDIDMPKLNGLQVIDAVMQKTSVPIAVITSMDAAETAYEAALKGALEFYSKDAFASSLPPEKRKQIYDTLKRISGVSLQKNVLTPADIEPVSIDAAVFSPPPKKQIAKREISAVVIASSTGGPKALSRFFSLTPADFPAPFALVQHNSSGFDKSFAQWLGSYTPLKVKVAEEGEELKAGTIYVAQTDKHLTLGGNAVLYDDGEPENNQKPAADALFRSAALCYKERLISVVLTGMGCDGAAGTRAVREAGGVTFAQDEASSLIYGMPKAAAETGCVDLALPLDAIPPELARIARP